MLLDSITLWPGGPSVVLDDYFVYFKYIFSFLFLLWAAGILLWPNRRWLLGGILFLSVFSWKALDQPLDRPYGVTEEYRGLFELAQPMVSAARGTGNDGWMVHQPNPRLLWSMVLAGVSGFEPARLLALYPWIPLASLVFLVLALYWGLGGKASEGTEGSLSPALAVFVAVFLCSHRLSILQSPGPLWTYCFWLQPYLGFTFGLLFVWIRLLGGAERHPRFGLAGIVLGVFALLEPHVGLYALAGILSWTALARRSIGRVSLALALAGAVFWLGRGTLQPVPLAEESRAWYVAFNSLLSLTLDKGLVFYLGCFGLIEMIRSRKPHSSLLASLWVSGFVLWIVSAFSTSVAAVLHPELLQAYLQLLLAVAGGLGAYRALDWVALKLENMPALPNWIRDRGLQTVAIASFVALSLPWCFPYWWHAPRMDPVYAASVPPISRQFAGLADWIRTGTSKQAVFVAGPSYAPWIAALSGRRVLLVDSGFSAPNDLILRKQSQSRISSPRDIRAIEQEAEKWDVTHFAWGRLDQEAVQVDYGFFESHPEFVERYRLRRWVRVFELPSR